MDSVTGIEKYDEGSDEWILVEDIAALDAGDRIRTTFANGASVVQSYVAPTVRPLSEIHQDKLRELYYYGKRFIEQRESWYANGERYLWPELESECAAYIEDPEVMGRNLTAQEALGLSAAVNAPRIIAAAGSLVGLVAAVIVNRTAHITALQALADADDLEGVRNYDFSGGWPA